MCKTTWVGRDSMVAAPVKPTGMTRGAGASPVPHIAGQARQSERIGCGAAGTGSPAGVASAAGTQISLAEPAVTAGTAKPDNIACNATA